jgi:hypothetical protein
MKEYIYLENYLQHIYTSEELRLMSHTTRVHANNAAYRHLIKWAHGDTPVDWSTFNKDRFMYDLEALPPKGA